MPDAQGIVPFGQPRSSGVPHQFAMEIIGSGIGRIAMTAIGVSTISVTQRAHQQQLPRRRLQQIRATYDFRDPHGRVVDHDRELVSGNIVAPPNEKIAKIAARDVALPAEIQIREFNHLALGNAEPPVHAHRLGELSRILALTTCPWIQRLIVIVIVSIIRSACRQREILARTSAGIQKTAGPQPPPSLQIVRPALTLRVSAVRTAKVRPLAPTNSQPSQIFNHGASKFRSRALRIQILIPQN